MRARLAALLWASLSRFVGAASVEAGTLATVTAVADLYEPSLSAENGCDPSGCVAELTRDGDVSDESRWSCAPSLGGTCSISYDLGAVRVLSELRLALYQGTTRVRTVDVAVDGSPATTWTSSGTTDDFESIDLTGYSGQDITVTGVLDDLEWISIKETEIIVVSDDVVSSPSPSTTTQAPVLAPVATPSPTVATPEQLWSAQEIGTQDTTVTTTADLFDPDLSIDSGCDPAGCTAALTRDGDMGDASRWSCTPNLGDEGAVCSISYDLGREFGLDELRVALYNGDIRVRTVDVFVDGALVTTWTSSGTTDGFESIQFIDGIAGTVVELQGVLGNSEWLSIIETEIMVWPQNVVTPPPAPAATVPPAPAPVQPVTPPSPTPVGELQPVGLTPLASGSGSDIDLYYAKDGDLSTSWTCTGNPTDDDGNTDFDCELSFYLVYYRRIKQVKIALADGAEREVDMRLEASFLTTVAEELCQEFVTSSGTTDGFETYDFDYYANRVVLSVVFSSPGESVSISEVEIVEEMADGQALIDGFSTPDVIANEPTTDGFEWISESEGAIDEILSLSLSGYYTVTELQLLFPEGDTYMFDLTLHNGLDDTSTSITALESTDTAGFQSFDLTGAANQYVTSIGIQVKGTGSGSHGFAMLDAVVLGTKLDNPTDTLYVGSTFIQYWSGDEGGYPDFVCEGTGDQNAINGAICAVKKGTLDGVDCVDMDDSATGTVDLSHGDYFVNGNIFMKSGVHLEGLVSDEHGSTQIFLEEGAAGNTDIDAIVVMDDIRDAWLQEVWIVGLYDPDTSNDSPAVPGLGSICLSIVNSQNITCEDLDVYFCDGDAAVVRGSTLVNLDAGHFDEELTPQKIGLSRGTGLIVDSSDSVWVRSHTFYDNGVAGLHIMGSNNFTFEATIDDYEGAEGQGNVGSLDGQQPIEVIVEGSSLVTFQDMKVTSANDPVMTISESTTVSFTNGGYSSVAAGTCIIQTDDPSTVTIDADEDELVLEDTCYVKV